SGIKDIEGKWYLVAFQSIRSINANIAVEASKKPQHTAATKLANMSNYEFYDLERYVLKKKKNETEIKIIQISEDTSI
ncbi:24578_t:CDS:2, partial [Gigaspora rosea]